jgi:hypothetical protein
MGLVCLVFDELPKQNVISWKSITSGYAMLHVGILIVQRVCCRRW